MAFEKVKENLEGRGYTVQVFDSGKEAAAYLDSIVSGTTVGIGGSATVKELGLYDMLASHNEVHWHWATGLQEREKAISAKVYITSANGLAETGEIINIDGVGNRVSATLYGHEKVYFIIGKNKLAPTYDEALWRARNIAAPKNAQSKNRKTPCAVKGDRCYNCKSPERICKALVFFWGAVDGLDTEILLVDEDLGF